MEHQQAQSLVADYVAGALSGRRLGRFSTHLVSCAPCQREVQTYWRLRRALERHLRDEAAQNQPSLATSTRLLGAVRRAPPPHRRWAWRLRATAVALRPPLPALQLRLVAAGLVAAALVGGALPLVLLQPLRPGGVLALSLETPVRGTFTVVDEAPVVSGSFAYVTADRWYRQMTLHRVSEGERYVEEKQEGLLRSQRFGPEDDWELVGPMPPEFGPFPGLAELGPPARLFDALLQLYQLERRVTTTVDGQPVVLYEGKDAGYARRLKQRLEGTVAPDFLEQRYRWFTQYPPRVWLYADDHNRIISVVLVVLSPDAAQPTVTAIKITETNADVTIP